MNDRDKYKINFSGSTVGNAGFDPVLERVLEGLGFMSVAQLYGAMLASPDAFRELLKDYNVTYECMEKSILEQLTDQEKAELSERIDKRYSMGQNLGNGPKDTGRTVIRREPKSS